MNINMQDKYTTEDGCEVKIYSVKGNQGMLIHGAIRKSNCYQWKCWQWTGGGRCGAEGKDLILSIDSLIKQANDIYNVPMYRVKMWLEIGLMQKDNREEMMKAVKEALLVLEEV